MGVPSLSGVLLTLKTERVRFPLEAMRKRRRTADTFALRPPRIGAPDVGDELELHPVRDIAVREILSHADHGTARVYLPLIGSRLKKGPFSIEVAPGSEAVIDFVVEAGQILRDRDRTRGTIVPSISLPLGLKFRGIFIDEEDGSVIADIARFPDINLSWLNVAKLRIPASLEGMLGILFKDKPPGPEQLPPKPKDSRSLQVQLKKLRVEARDVVPRDLPLSLGDAGELVLGPDTRLDVDYTRELLEIGGHVDIPRADLRGPGFTVRGLRALGTGSAALDLGDGPRQFVMEMRCPEVSFESGTLHLLDGSLIQLAEASAEDVEIVLSRSKGEAHFHVASRAFRGKVTGGTLMTWIGRKMYPVELAEMDVEGAFAVSDRRFEIDVEVRGARVDLAEVSLPLGLAYLDIARLDASGSGHLKAGTDIGYHFAGSLAVNAEVSGGRFVTGPVSGRLLDDTQVAMTVARIGGHHRLREIEASGTVEANIASGSVPVGGGYRLQFSRGAVGTFALHSILLEPGDAWPRIDAGAQFTAHSDALRIPDSIDLPGGSATAEIPTIRLESDGDLLLEEIAVHIASDDNGDDPDDG